MRDPKASVKTDMLAFTFVGLLLATILGGRPKQQTVDIATVPVPFDNKANAEVFKEVYKEALNDYRYFGTLRGAISWPPATIVGAAIGFLGRNTDFGGSWLGVYAPPVAYTLILLMICVINYILQLYQARSRGASRLAQKRWIASITSNIGAQTLTKISHDKDCKWRKRPDLASLLFFLFSAALAGMAFFVAANPTFVTL
jgi:hypothetical protein